MERDWDRQMGLYEQDAWDVQSPMRRLNALGRLDRYGIAGAELNAADIAQVIETMRARPALYAKLGQVFAIWGTIEVIYGNRLETVTEVIQHLRASQP